MKYFGCDVFTSIIIGFYLSLINVSDYSGIQM